MYRSAGIKIACILALFLINGCMGSTSPVTPGAVTGTPTSPGRQLSAQTHLWGYYNVLIDFERQTIEVVLNRDVMFTANVVTFLNSNPLCMTFHINDTPTGPDYIDVDIDVSLTHPFPGMPQYNGYDVRGVFMGDGSLEMAYGDDLAYPAFGTDQYMLPDPDGGNGAPDGYTRWFNWTEFSTGGSSLLQYTQGKMATPGFAGSATLCPYSYFADGLGPNDDLWTWLNEHADQNGQFSSGATNTRNYYLRFPTPSPNVVYGYAVIANWEGEEPEFHPSNSVESVVCDVVDASNVYYVDPDTNGGNLILDISLFGWEYQPSTINIESTVLGSVYNSDAGAIAVGGGDNFSTYHVEIPADSVTDPEDNKFWVIAEYGEFDYSNEFGILNDAWDEPLAAFFRYDLFVSNQTSGVPEFTFSSIYFDGYGPDGTSDFPVPSDLPVDFDASASTGASTYDWDFDSDGTYEYVGDTTPFRSYAFPYDPGETYPVTYTVTLRINGGSTISHPIVITRGVYVDGMIGSSGGTGEITDPYNTINNGVTAAVPANCSVVMVCGDDGSSGQQVYNERINLDSSHSGIGLQGYSLNTSNSMPPAMRDFTPPYRDNNGYWYSECIYGLDADDVTVDGFEFENIRGVDDPNTHWSERVNVIIFVDSDNVQVSHTYCHHIFTNDSYWGWKPGYHINLNNCDSAKVENNLFTDAVIPADWGTVDWLYARDCANLVVCNNTVDQVDEGPWTGCWWVASTHGVSLYNTTSSEILNTLITNLTGIRWLTYPAGGGWGCIGSGNIDPVVDYCNVWNIRRAYGHPPTVNYSLWYRFDGDITEGPNCTNPGPADQDYGSDPLYVDTIYNHQLNTGSPCIDTGDPDILDYDGSQSDMGCYGGPGGDWNFEN